LAYAGLRFFIWVQLFYLVNNVAEFFVRDPALKHMLASFDYVLIGSGPALWLLFSLEYTGTVRRYKPWMGLLFALPVAACVTALAQGADGAIWRGLEFYPYPWGLAMRSRGYGPLALSLFAYDYSLIVVGSFILMRETIRYYIDHPRHFLYMEQYFNSPYSVSIHRDIVLGKGREDAWGDVFERGMSEGEIKDLPRSMLFALAFGPMIFLLRDHIRGFICLVDEEITRFAEVCWNVIKK